MVAGRRVFPRHALIGQPAEAVKPASFTVIKISSCGQRRKLLLQPTSVKVNVIYHNWTDGELGHMMQSHAPEGRRVWESELQPVWVDTQQQNIVSAQPSAGFVLTFTKFSTLDQCLVGENLIGPSPVCTKVSTTAERFLKHWFLAEGFDFGETLIHVCDYDNVFSPP